MNAFEWGHRLPTITAGRMALRAMTEADVPDLFGVFSDPEVMRYWDGLPMTSPADAADYLVSIDEGFRTRQLFQWGICERAADRVIGTCTLLHVSAPHRRAEIGFALRQSRWGRGLATEAISALIGFTFEDLRLHRLEADVDPRNDRSLRLLERLGFLREGYLRQRYHVAGELQDTVLLGLLRSDWRPPFSVQPPSNSL